MLLRKGRFSIANTCGGVLITTSFLLSAVQAQTIPDAGRILQETRPSEPPPAITLPPIDIPKSKKPVVPVASADVRVNVTHFIFTGNTELSQETLDAAVAPWAGRSLNFGELIQAVEAIEARYKEAGYFLAQAYLPPQKIKDGAIEISISEGRLGETRLEGESRIAPDVLYAYLDRLPKGQALTLPPLERQVLLINELAGGKASLDLQAGEKPGTTDIVLAQTPDEFLTGRLDVNNHGAPSTGEKRYGLTLTAGSLFNLGERINLNAMASDGMGLKSFNLRGELPVGGDGWRLSASASRAEYSLGGAFANLKASGTADSLRLGAAYPLLRSRASNLKVQLEADQSQLADKFQSTSTELDKTSRGLTLSLSADHTDELLGGGSSRADLLLRRGQLALGATAAAQDTAGTAGAFSKLNLNVQRQQNVSSEVSLTLQLSYQLAGKNLDSSEKMSMGGAATLPGYANGEASGDSGLQTKLSARWQLLPELALTAFTDYVRLKLAHDPVAGTTKNDKRLTDAGIGIDWLIDKQLTASAILAWAGRETPNAADNDKPRFWFSLGWMW